MGKLRKRILIMLSAGLILSPGDSLVQAAEANEIAIATGSPVEKDDLLKEEEDQISISLITVQSAKEIPSPTPKRSMLR